MAGSKSRDHVVARSFFETPPPKNLPTVPTCVSCNNAVSAAEERIRNHFVRARADAQSQFPEVSGSAERSRTLSWRRYVPAPRLLRTKTGVVVFGDASRVDQNDIDMVFQKITRGFFFRVYRRRLPVDINTAVTLVARDDVDRIVRLVRDKARAPLNRLGDVFAWAHSPLAEDADSGIWVYFIYDAGMVAVTTGRMTQLLTPQRAKDLLVGGSPDDRT